MWCLGVARNVLRNFYGRATRSRALHASLSQHASHAVGVVDSAEATVPGHDEARVVAAALDTLEPAVRECTLLMTVDCLGPRQTANRLQIDEATAASWLATGLEKLREELLASSFDTRCAADRTDT